MNRTPVFSDVLKKNIAELSEKQIVLSERRICELAELAECAVNYSKSFFDMGIYEILSFISDEYPENENLSFNDSVFENQKRLRTQLTRLSAMDKAHFAELYTEFSHFHGMTLSENSFLSEDVTAETFVYVKNVYADEAYDVFSQDFTDPRVRYAKDFREAAKMVSDGIVTYCILPLEERGARLASVAELLYRSELKINSVIPVFGIDGAADVKYALVSLNFSVPRRDPDDDRYLEIRIADDSPPSLSELLCAAENHGVRVYRVNTLTFDTEDGKKGYYSIVFFGENADFTSLLVYLTLFASDYTVVGIYKNLEL